MFPMNIDRNKTAAFSGHRSFKMTKGETSLFSSLESNLSLSERIENALRQLCEKGYDTFLCGMAEGFDLMAGEAVIRLRNEFPGVRLLAIIPHPGQATSFKDETRAVYESVISNAAWQTTVCRYYSHDCFHRRNDFLVDNSTALVCYYNGTKGGTEYTVKRAIRQGLEIINVI